MFTFKTVKITVNVNFLVWIDFHNLHVKFSNIYH
jgi:hypothetical protein